MTEQHDPLAGVVRQAARSLEGGPGDYDALLDLVGEARFVLLGEASHGSHEFYDARAEITKRLVREKGFNAVAVEADWPDAHRVNRYARGVGDDPTALDALADFQRFPAWMWRNTDVLAFVGWLREHNDALRDGERKVGFYGLDLYSLHSSMEAVIGYLDKVDPEAAKRARYRYSCFDHYGVDPQAYGAAISYGRAEPCEDEVVRQLVELQSRRPDYARLDGRLAEDEAFFAVQNARVAVHAEEYYRTMFHSDRSSWNLRDSHMAETLAALVEHLDRQGAESKVVVWEHNSHIGDARATQSAEHGELNVGQLVRERYGVQAFLVGFTTHAGMVSAASDWGAPVERKRVRPSLPGSYENLFHQTALPRLLLDLRAGNVATAALRRRRLERAIGVIYLPFTERLSHYFYARLPEQFDAVLHFDQTRAVEPLERTSTWEQGEEPETYPFAV
ncbi:MAG: erythromycin esterase family protein [Chloroflexota bacterium]